MGSNYGQVLGALSYNSTRVLAFDLPSSECLLIMPQECAFLPWVSLFYHLSQRLIMILSCCNFAACNRSATQLSSSMMFTDQFRWKGHTPVLDQAFSMLTQPSRFPFDAVKSELEDLELTPSQTKPDASSASTS